MAGKHAKKPSRYGISAGPGRWERAAAYALKHPNTQHARLYYGRVTIAHQIASVAHEGQDFARGTVFAHNTYGWKNGRLTQRRLHYTCGVFCMVMQLQINSHITSLEDVDTALSKNITTYRGEDTGARRVEILTRKDLPRSVRCQACGTAIVK